MPNETLPNNLSDVLTALDGLLDEMRRGQELQAQAIRMLSEQTYDEVFHRQADMYLCQQVGV